MKESTSVVVQRDQLEASGGVSGEGVIVVSRIEGDEHFLQHAACGKGTEIEKKHLI